MSNLNFDYLDITTVTAMVDLTGRIKIIPAFFLMEVTRIDIPPEIASKKKFKLPTMDSPGEVLSLTTLFANKKQFTRGIDKSRAFKNTITMDVSFTGKNGVLKIYQSQIHMCGVKSREMAMEAGTIVIEKLEKAQSILEYIKAHPDEMTKTIEWVKEHTRGKTEYVEEETVKIVEKDNIKALTPEMIDFLKREALEEMEEQAPEGNNGQSGPLINIVEDDSIRRTNMAVTNLIEEFIISQVSGGVGPVSSEVLDGLQEAYYDSLRNQLRSNIGKNSDSNAIMESGPVNIPEVKINPNLVGYIPKKNERGWVGVEKVNYVILPPEFIQQGYHSTHSSRPTDSYPEGVDGVIANFLIDQAFDFERHDLYSAHLDWITSLDNIIEGDIGISNIYTSMVNYNYSLGFRLKRGELSDRIYGICGLIPIYENTFDHSVKIELPYDIPDEFRDKIKLKRKPRHTFMLYKSGNVTQSGPCEELARDAYVVFNQVIKSIRSYVEEPSDDVFDLKVPFIDEILKKNLRNGIDWSSDGTIQIIPKNQGQKFLKND